MKCEKCGVYGSELVWVTDVPVRLCTACCRRWDRDVLDRELWEKWEKSVASVRRYSMGGEILGGIESALVLKWEAFQKGMRRLMAWLEEGKEED